MEFPHNSLGFIAEMKRKMHAVKKIKFAMPGYDSDEKIYNAALNYSK